MTNKVLVCLPQSNWERVKCLVIISYEYKNQLEKLTSRRSDPFEIPAFSILPKDKFTAIPFPEKPSKVILPLQPIIFKSRTSRKKYLTNAQALIRHIQLGDIYEVNYCIEFFAENVRLENPFGLFVKLYQEHKAPHSVYFKQGPIHLICLSPERFLKKEGDRLISQPIKGTRPRGGSAEEDARLINDLSTDPKERAENIMIADLVRNDLSKVAVRGSVKVDELCGIHTFEKVHQMVSTISCQLRDEVSFEEIILSTFPMGSMTGAPKVSAMRLIDQYEDMNRSLYSGSVGWMDENGNFDLNVVIRSFLYNEETGYLSLRVGSALTANCDPQKEYEECLVKALPLIKAVNGIIE